MTNTQEQYPPIGVVVEAQCRCSQNWPAALGGAKVHEQTTKIRRIKTNSNSRGWQWSHPEIETYFQWEVLTWKYID